MQLLKSEAQSLVKAEGNTRSREIEDLKAELEKLKKQQPKKAATPVPKHEDLEEVQYA